MHTVQCTEASIAALATRQEEAERRIWQMEMTYDMKGLR